MERGFFDKMVPPLTEEQKERFDILECDICHQKYRNNIDKQKFPAWGTIVCHLGNEHGKLIHLMEKDPEVDMTEVIELLKETDEKMKNAAEEVDKATDVKLVTLKEGFIRR